MSEPTPTPSATTPANSPPSPRWWPAAVILGIAVPALGALYWRDRDDITARVFDTLYVLPAALFALGIWWNHFSRLSLRTRLIPWGVLALGVVLFLVSFRLEGFQGEFQPVFVGRWQPTKEEKLAAYQKQLAESAKSAEPAAQSETTETTGDPVADAAPEFGPATDADWPMYRRDLSGIVTGANLRRDWEAKPPTVVWKHPIGLGWSSCAIVADRIYTQEQRRDEEVVVCYDFETGRELWVHADPVRFEHAVGGTGPRGTPTYVDGLLYTLGGTGILNCLEAKDGTVRWSHNILSDASAQNIEWGMSGSPFVDGDLVLVNAGGKEKSLVAYNRHDGRILWTAGDDVASYATPQPATISGEKQYLMFNGLGIVGHSASDGRPLWRFPWTNPPKVNAAQPIPLEYGRILISNGYGTGSALLQVHHEGTAAADGTVISQKWVVKQIWKQPRAQWKFASGVVRGDYAYGLDEGLLTCFRVEDGKRQWRDRDASFGFGQLILADDLLIILAENGDVALVEATPDAYRELGRLPVLEGVTWNNPSLYKGRLIVRNAQELAVLDLR